MATFSRFDRRLDYRVAVFEVADIGTASGVREFCLNRHNLELRIENLERENYDASMERAVLAQMEQ